VGEVCTVYINCAVYLSYEDDKKGLEAILHYPTRVKLDTSCGIQRVPCLCMQILAVNTILKLSG
jgi:hypothetical protein